MTISRSDHAHEGGVTLIELLIAIAIMGVAFVIIAGGMATYITGSVLHRSEATVQVELQKYVTALQATAYSSCLTAYTVPGYTGPTGVSATPYVSVTNTVLLWNSATATYSTTPPASPCNAAGSQLVTVTAKFADGDSAHDYSETLSVGRRS
jgi:prepilin-type N-terminal cleavage/methylation domain-containing protein